MSKRYRFKLEKVLDYRKDKEMLAKQELAGLQKKLQEENNLMDRLKTEYQDNTAALQEGQHKELDLEGLKLVSHYLSYLEEEIKGQQEVIIECLEEVDGGKNRVKKTMQDRKTLEILKEKEQQNFIHRINNDEQNLNDEAGLRCHLNNNLFQEVIN